MSFFKKSIYTSNFWLLCWSNFLFSASFQMIIPELPDFLRRLGGEEYIGYIIALFTLTAGLARPFSGKLSDTIGRVPVMAFGSLVCFVCSLMYPFIQVVAGFLLLRFIHGFSTGTKPTGTAAYVADVTPENRRGEAAGTLGIFTAIGMSVGPTMGSLMAAYFSLQSMFVVSSLLALLSILILLKLPETLANPQPFSWKHLRIQHQDLFEPRAFSPFLVCLLVSYSSGVAITLTPDQSVQLGLVNKGLFFTIYTIASLLVRLVFAKTSDRHGRIPVLMVSTLVLAVGMWVMAEARSPAMFYAASVLFGLSWGMNTPTLTAWTIDVALPQWRGRAMATLYIALEAGIGLGAYLTGLLLGGKSQHMALCYQISAGLALLGFVYLFWLKNRPVSSAEF
jgi:MFS family permease